MDRNTRASQIILLAVAMNVINRGSNPNPIDGTLLRNNGKEYLVTIVTSFVENYESLFHIVRATCKWEEFVALHCQFALTLRDGVFVGRSQCRNNYRRGSFRYCGEFR